MIMSLSKEEKKMKRIISLCVIFAMLLCMNPIRINAEVISMNSDVQQFERMTTIFSMYIEELEMQANELLDLSGEEAIDVEIERFLTIHDFAGNEYTLVECAPSGYIIYHNESGTFVEGSVVAQSPYLGISGEKYYGGPNEYYSKK